jgi:hypothetical protein
MIEWIKREDRKPPTGVVVIHTDGLDFWTVQDIGHNEWTHWMPLPAPPPRMVTIEISEDLARTAYENSRGWPLNSSWRKLGDACAKALETER